MLSKNVTFKCSETYTNKQNKKEQFSVEITVKSNHIINSQTLENIERNIYNNMNLYDYDKQKKIN